MKHATFVLAAVCAAVLLTVIPVSDSEAHNDAVARQYCTTAMEFARDRNVKLTDIKFSSWKVENAWYDANRDPFELNDENAQYRCSIAAQCPETPWPSDKEASIWYADGNPYNPDPSNKMYYDDPRRVWNHTSYTGSVTEIQKVRCVAGGYLYD